MSKNFQTSEPFSAATQASENVRDIFGRIQRTAVNGAEHFAEEGFRFWSRRMNAYADHLSALQKCQSPGDMMSLNSAFMSKTMADYAEEARSVIELGKKQAAEVTESAKNSQAA